MQPNLLSELSLLKTLEILEVPSVDDLVAGTRHFVVGAFII